MNEQRTIEKIEAASDGKPEYVDSNGLRAVFGVSRSLGYALINDGSVKSICLRKRGASRGKRLWVAESVRAYLNSCVDQPAEQPKLEVDIENIESPKQGSNKGGK